MSLPAAKQNDIVQAVDVHIIMIPTPAGPVPTPLPHPFVGMLDTALSTDVQIEGMAAATVDSIANAKPPHIPQGGPFQKPPSNQGKVFMGSATVMINGKPAARSTDMCMTCNDPSDLPVGLIISTTATVFIGGPPSKAGSAASGSSASQGAAKQAAAQQAENAVEEAKESVEFKVEREDGQALEGAEYELLLPDGTKKTGSIGSDGTVKEEELTKGIALLRLKGVHNPRWEVEVGVAAEPLKMVSETACLEDGTAVKFEVFREFEEGEGESVGEATGKVKDGLASAEWTYKFEERDAGVCPRFVFHASSGESKAIAPVLEVGDKLEVELKDQDGKKMAGWPVKVIGRNGKEYNIASDESGKIELRGLAFGPCRLLLKDGAVVREAKS